MSRAVGSLAEWNSGQDLACWGKGSRRCKNRTAWLIRLARLSPLNTESFTNRSLRVCLVFFLWSLDTLCQKVRWRWFVPFLDYVFSFSTPVKPHIWMTGTFIFSSIYVPEQEGPLAEKYCFLLGLLLLLYPNALQNMFTPLQSRACPMSGCFCCVLARQQWYNCVFEWVWLKQ